MSLREIIGEYMMELPVFDNKKLNSAPNQQRKKKILKPIRIHTLSTTRRRQCKYCIIYYIYLHNKIVFCIIFNNIFQVHQTRLIKLLILVEEHIQIHQI